MDLANYKHLKNIMLIDITNEKYVVILPLSIRVLIDLSTLWRWIMW
jgi:hypothetical protein